MSTARIAYFGYGSLVNLDSLRTPYISAHRARLTGWQRVWLARPRVEGSFAAIDGLAFLSAERNDEAEIDGMVIVDHRTSLPDLDEREALYSRVTLTSTDVEFLDGSPLDEDDELFLYVADPPAVAGKASILLSYLDVVMQGYFKHFGEDGLKRFVETTANFNCPIKDDREEPLYPRSVVVSEAETALFARCFEAG